METQRRVLITDSVHHLLIEQLQQAGFECDYQPAILTNDVFNIIEQYVGLIINSKILVDQKMLDKGAALQFIGRLGSGMEIVDRSYAKQKGIAVYSSPEGNRNAVAEHAIGMLLALSNNLLKADSEVRQFAWNREKNRGFELEGKTIGIIGFGNTGSTLAKKLSSWDVNVLAYDKYISNYAIGYKHVEETTLDHLVKQADIISLHVPLTADTHHLVNKNFLNRLEKQIVLINTSRGKVVNTKDLTAALHSGKLLGACLDVFENEKPETFSQEEREMYSELYQFDNVILSPHVAGWTKESKRKLAETLVNKILSE